MSTIHPSPVVLSSVYQRLSHPGKHLKDLKAQSHFLQAHRTKQTHLVTPSFHFNRDPKLLDIQRHYCMVTGHPLKGPSLQQLHANRKPTGLHPGTELRQS